MDEGQVIVLALVATVISMWLLKRTGKEDAENLALGALILVFGIGFWRYAVGGNPLHELALIRGAEVTHGLLVDSWEDVDAWDEPQYSYGYTYTYRVRGHDYERSHSRPGRLDSEYDFQDGPVSVEVEYLPANPEISRLKGSGTVSLFDWLWRKAGLGTLLLAMFAIPGIRLMREGFRALFPPDKPSLADITD